MAEIKRYFLIPYRAFGTGWMFTIFVCYLATFLFVRCVFPVKLPSSMDLFCAWLFAIVMTALSSFKRDTITLHEEFIEATDTFFAIKPTRIYRHELGEIKESITGLPLLRRSGLLITSQGKTGRRSSRSIFIPSSLPDYAEIKERLTDWVPLAR